MNSRKSDERKPPLYYATLSIMLVAFALTAAQANTEEPSPTEKVQMMVDAELSQAVSYRHSSHDD